MANRYSKVNTQNRVNGENEYRELQKFEEEKSSITPGARMMAIIVIAAMVVTTFLAAGIFMFD